MFGKLRIGFTDAKRAIFADTDPPVKVEALIVESRGRFPSVSEFPTKSWHGPLQFVWQAVVV